MLLTAAPEFHQRHSVTPPENAVLHALNRYHFLTAQQVQRLRYSGGSLTYVQSMLKRLAEQGYCQRLWLPRATQHGSAPSVFRLATNGLNFLREQGVAVNARYRPSDHNGHSYLFLNHTLALNDFLITAELLARQRPEFSLAGFLHEQDLKRQPFYVDVAGERQAVIPDAWLDFRAGDLYQVCLAVELDMGTEEQKKWRRKVRALTAFANGPYQEAFGTTSLTIAVVVASGERRLSELLTWTEAELRAAGEDQNASLFLFVACSPAQLSPDDLFFRPCWYQPFGQHAVALFEGVD